MPNHKTLIFPDIHTPLHDNCAINAVLEFAKYFKPDRFIQLGDLCDFTSLSPFALYTIGEFTYIEDEIEASNLLLDRIEKSLPKKCEKYLIGGNHEDRYRKSQAKMMFAPDKISKSLKKWKSWQEEYNLKKRGWKSCEYNEYFYFWKIVYTHGNVSGKMNAAKMMAEQYPGRNVIFGHTHRHQVFGAVDEKVLPIESETIGTLSRMDLPMMRGRTPTDWCHGFMYITTRKSEKFTKTFTNIIDGEFTRFGKEYDGKRD